MNRRGPRASHPPPLRCRRPAAPIPVEPVRYPRPAVRPMRRRADRRPPGRRASGGTPPRLTSSRWPTRATRRRGAPAGRRCGAVSQGTTSPEPPSSRNASTLPSLYVTTQAVSSSSGAAATQIGVPERSRSTGSASGRRPPPPTSTRSPVASPWVYPYKPPQVRLTGRF